MTASRRSQKLISLTTKVMDVPTLVMHGDDDQVVPPTPGYFRQSF